MTCRKNGDSKPGVEIAKREERKARLMVEQAESKLKFLREYRFQSQQGAHRRN